MFWCVLCLTECTEKYIRIYEALCCNLWKIYFNTYTPFFSIYVCTASCDCRVIKLYLKKKNGLQDRKGREIAVNLSRIFVENSFVYSEGVVVLTSNSQSFGPLLSQYRFFHAPKWPDPSPLRKKIRFIGLLVLILFYRYGKKFLLLKELQAGKADCTFM